jgi:hypothetical protein
MAGVRGEPVRQPPVLVGFRPCRWRVDAKDLRAHFRMLQRSVQVRAADAVATHAVNTAVVEPRKRYRMVVEIERGVAQVDLIAAESNPAGRGRHDCARPLLSSERGDGRQQTQSFGRSTTRLHARRIADASSQHLIAAADTEDRCAEAMPFENPIGQTDLTQPEEIGHGVLAAGQDDEIVGLSGRRAEPVGPGQQPEVGGVREMREVYDRDPRTRGRRGGRPGVQRQAVLGVQLHVGRVREHAEAGRPGALFEDFDAGVEQGQVATKLVDGEAAKQRPLVGAQQVGGANHRAEHPTPLDVGDEQPRSANSGDEAEIDQVAIAQVQLAHTAGAFDHDHVESARQIVIGLEHLRTQLVGVGVVLARGQGLPHTAVHNHLTRAVATRLEQNWIHGGLGLESAGFGLRHLGAADFAAKPARI